MKPVLFAVVVAGLCACSTTPSRSHAGSPTTTTGRSGSSSAATVPYAGATTTGPTTTLASHGVGYKASYPGGTIQVLGYSAPVATATSTVKPSPGNIFAVIDVQACAGATATPSPGPATFVLQLPDGSFVTPRASVKDPAYVLQRLAPGACERGFVSFQVPAATRPLLVAAPALRLAWTVS